ncbi:hypothetical protein L596_007909 [Steinernema carpocapsae]|uniref:Uncharacterized protein n=1 Tax=Steinernema carpocapsae TaxID=34508 RepID=A0A4U5PBU9_STECR|nr:hypothetical protein L596_007909 [Steinernema carpocapsae]
MLQEASLSLLFPLFERGRLEPTHRVSRRLQRKNHDGKCSSLCLFEPGSPSLLSPLFGRKKAQKRIGANFASRMDPNKNNPSN